MIDQNLVNEDRKVIRMSPEERYQYLVEHYGVNPTRAQCTDEALEFWFKNLARDGQRRLELASAIQAPPNLSIEALSYWHKRACELLGAKSPQDVTIVTA